MALSWCKVASNLDSHPKIRKAGRNGREVFLFALRRNAEPGNPVPGRLPMDELEPWYVADQLQMPEGDAVTGVTAAVTAGLLAIDGRSYVIVGWEEEWGKVGGQSGADRTKRWREKQKSNELAPPVTSHVTGVTSPKVTRDDGDACDGLEEKRREEKREEDLSGKPDDPALAFAEKAVALINAHAGTKYRPSSDAILKLCRTLIRNKHTLAQAERVIASKRAWVDDPKMGQYFRPATLLAAKNFATYLDDIEAAPQLARGAHTMPRMSADREEARSPLMLGFDAMEAGSAAP